MAADDAIGAGKRMTAEVFEKRGSAAGAKDAQALVDHPPPVDILQDADGDDGVESTRCERQGLGVRAQERGEAAAGVAALALRQPLYVQVDAISAEVL